MSAYSKEQLHLLKQFVGLCKSNVNVLYLPELEFFKSWLEELGAKIPPQSSKAQKSDECPKESCCGDKTNCETKKESPENVPSESEEEPEEPESEVDLDNTGVIEGDKDEPQEMGNKDAEVSEDDIERSDAKRGEAQQKLSEGNFEEAVELFTEAIKLNPNSAILFAKRSNAFIKLNKPNAAIRDCNRALEINSNSQQALKWRGYAYKLLGQWEEAHVDLCKAQNNDYDEQVAEWIKGVAPNANKLKEHKRKQQRKRDEKLLKEREKARQKAQQEYEKAKKQESTSRSQESRPGFSMPGAGAAGGGMPDLSGLLNDPDILKDFSDPEVSRAFQEISADPSKILQYQNNPKVKRVIEKLSQKVGGGAGAGMGGFPGGMGGGFPGGMGGSFPGGFPFGGAQ